MQQSRYVEYDNEKAWSNISPSGDTSNKCDISEGHPSDGSAKNTLHQLSCYNGLATRRLRLISEKNVAVLSDSCVCLS